MNVAIVHPDLGLGGAERLILDVALALKRRRYNVKIFTGHHDRNRCFNETRDGTLDVNVIGASIPRTLLNRFHAILAYIRMIWIAIYLVYFSNYKFDLIICDQVSVCVPFLRLSRKFTIFYCHYPDQLLTHRNNLLKKIYRIPLDWLEYRTTGMADLVLVNSQFTKRVFRETFPKLANLPIQVLYPTVNMTTFERFKPSAERLTKIKSTLNHDDFIVLSLNRYERKKNLELAIRALAILVENDHTTRPKIHLIIAGGYDERLSENCDYYDDLVRLAFELSVRPMITFIKSPTDEEKLELYHLSHAVVYTPENEHFGIVPLEAMAMGRPVIACKSGGPLETIIHEKTGYLCQAQPEAFALALASLAIPNDNWFAARMGDMARKHVEKHFSFERFSSRLVEICEKSRRG